MLENTSARFDYVGLSFHSSFLVDDGGKHLSAHLEAKWQRIQPFINHQNTSKRTGPLTAFKQHILNFPIR